MSFALQNSLSSLFVGFGNGGVLEKGSFQKAHCLEILTYEQPYNLSGFKKALLQNPREMIRGRIFREMIRVSAGKSELQAKSRSCRPKVGVYSGADPQNPNRIGPEKEPESGLGASAENPP